MNHPQLAGLLLALQDAPTPSPGRLQQLFQPAFGNLIESGPDQYRVLGWIVLLPLIGAIINGVFGRWMRRDAVYIIGVGTVASSFVLALFAFFALWRADHSAAEAAHALAATAGGEHGEEAARAIARLSYNAGDWFHAPAGGGHGLIQFRYVLDALSGVMVLVVTGVGTIIHVYSTGYMSHDQGYAKFFAFLNLFMFSMLNLILGDNIVLLFVGWEGVGLCSYLLIGFWYTNSQYASAGRKAFIVNRIGDVGMIIGITILAWKLGSYRFVDMYNAVTNGSGLLELSQPLDLDDFLANVPSSFLGIHSNWLHDLIYRVVPQFNWGDLATLMLFIGCTGKSAQIPLYIWLPDAMAGPTPVSALIHAATMVTAGVYLLCRMSFLYVHTPGVMAIVAVVGALTALFAATIALVQNEIKKVLAYSTVSQLGFMVLGCGVGAFSAGLFHVYTHAMFKACLFLGAGAVMHACRDKHDLRELGGLRRYMPYTFWTFAIATAAIIGMPGLSGFFSKDEILFRALASHNPTHPWVGKFTFWIGVMTAALTAFYMCRLLFLTFWGEFKGWSLVPGSASLAPAEGHQHLASPELHGAEADVRHHHHDDHDGHDHSAHAHAHAHAHADHDGHGHASGNPWDPPRDNPWNMTGPLVILAALSAVAGYIGLPYLFTHHEGAIERWLEPVVAQWHAGEPATLTGVETMAMLLGTAAFLLGSGAAYYVYVMQDGAPARLLATTARPLYRLVSDKWRIDELYDFLIVRPLRWFSTVVLAGIGEFLFDVMGRAFGWALQLFAFVLRKAQTGVLQAYGAVLAAGMIVLIAWIVLAPSATIAYHADGSRLTLQAYGGLGYSYEWDLEGDGTYGERTDQTRQAVSCNPHEPREDEAREPSVLLQRLGVGAGVFENYRVCRVGLRVRNAFGRTAEVTRTIEILPTETEEHHP